MMHISLSPQVSDHSLAVSVQRDILNINGDFLDLSILPDGAEIEDALARSLHPMIAGPIYREGGVVHVTLLLPYPITCSDPWMCFPAPIVLAEDGPVDLPFPTYSETTVAATEGGINIVTTTHRWHQEPEVSTEFVPNPVEEPEEAE
jgi:hypothetical protein